MKACCSLLLHFALLEVASFSSVGAHHRHIDSGLGSGTRKQDDPEQNSQPLPPRQRWTVTVLTVSVCNQIFKSLVVSKNFLTWLKYSVLLKCIYLFIYLFYSWMFNFKQNSCFCCSPCQGLSIAVFPTKSVIHTKLDELSLHTMWWSRTIH